MVEESVLLDSNALLGRAIGSVLFDDPLQLFELLTFQMSRVGIDVSTLQVTLLKCGDPWDLLSLAYNKKRFARRKLRKASSKIDRVSIRDELAGCVVCEPLLTPTEGSSRPETWASRNWSCNPSTRCRPSPNRQTACDAIAPCTHPQPVRAAVTKHLCAPCKARTATRTTLD